MDDKVLTTPVVNLVLGDQSPSTSIEGALTKVNKHLKRYARKLQRGVGELTLLDLCDERGELSPALLESIKSRPRKDACPQEEHDRYSGEIASRIKGIVRAILCEMPSAGQPREEVDGEIDLLALVPSPLQPIIEHLPRACGGRAKLEVRLASPLNKFGILQLRVALKVWERFGLTTLRDLLVTHWRDLYQEWRAVCAPEDTAHAYTIFRNLRLKAGFQIEPPPRALNWEELPPRIREQLEIYKVKALDGAAADHRLKDRAEKKHVALNPHTTTTIKDNCGAIALLLGTLPRADGIDITDLIRVEERVVVEDGEEDKEYFNPLIHAYREEERNKVLASTGKSCDSAAFKRLIHAIKAVAAYNGIFRYHKNFITAYRPRLDVKTREDLKARKKAAFSVKWVDGNLALLHPRFEEIVARESFKTSFDDLLLCLCYLYVMILRYTSVRQQGIRICRLGHNILFDRKTRCVTFHWFPKDVKNKKDVEMTIKPHYKHTVAQLNKALWLYHDKVYPYLERLAREQDVALGGLFFPQVTFRGRVRPFLPGRTGAIGFGYAFKKLTQRFFDFTDVEPSMRGKFNPHHLRGLAADWVKSLGLGDGLAATLQANDVATTSKHYLDQRKVNATIVFDLAEEREEMNRRRDRGAAAEITTDARVTDESLTVAALLDQIAAMTKQQADMSKQHADERAGLLSVITSLRDEVGKLNDLIAGLRSKAA